MRGNYYKKIFYNLLMIIAICFAPEPLINNENINLQFSKDAQKIY